MRSHRLLGVACAIIGFSGGSAIADETVRLRGAVDNGMTSNLKYTGDTAADIVPVFHGRIAACLLGCRRPVVVYAPVPVYQDCFGGFGGSEWPMPAAPMGYTARPMPAYSSAPSYAYRSPTPTYRLPPSQAIVSLPRLGLTFSFADDSGLTVGRSTIGNSLRERLPQQQEMPALPPIEPQTEQFQYDGGPTNPIPMPRSTRPSPPVDLRSAPAIDNRVKMNSPSPSWTAYGERQKRVPNSNSLLVQQRGR